MNDELHTGGVSAKTPLEHAVAGAEGEKIKMRWDFQDQDTWTATITQGAQKGVSKKTRVSKLSQDKWATVYPPGAVLRANADRVTAGHRGCPSCLWLGDQGMIFGNEQICECSASVINELISFVCDLLSEDCENVFMPKS